ncbi:MAG TPA: FAD-dependent oxidoreductase [Actinomycetota bacterium]
MRAADVVIVGGGCVGASAAYHLTAGGAGSVLLLERADDLGTGSTAAAAGGFRYQFGSEVNVRLSLASIPMLIRFEEEHGIPLDVHQDGYLLLVRDEPSWEGFRRAADMQRGLGVRVELLTGAEAAELIPGLVVDNVVGATFGPDDGIADTSGLTHGYATLARRAGAEIETGVDVAELLTEGDRVTGVRTEAGEVISAGAVVNAAGPWAGRLAITAGVDLPLDPIPRNVVVTGPFPGAPERRTLVVDTPTSFYFHREGPGVLMGMGSRAEQPSFDISVDQTFVADEILPTAMRVFPPIEEAGIEHTWCGLYEMTPDRHPILGEAVRGLYLANGFSGHGFQHSPIVGKLLAEMIVEGAASTVDVSSLSLDRFERGRPVVETHVI